MNIQDLISQIRRKRNFLCVGLDTDVKKLPQCVLDAAPTPADAIFDFNRRIIDATAPYAVAYKPNVAFYEAHGLDGWRALEATVQYLKSAHPDLYVIADAKRGDIGNTAALYARCFFEQMQVDAVTVAPYMGEDSVRPFLGYAGKAVILLALTSNKGSHDFQMLADASGRRLFEHVLERSQQWATDEEMMYVVGATQGALFEDVRRLAPRHFLLVPGVGAQGGSLEEVCRYGMAPDCRLLVNSSRGIIYADSTERFAEVAGEKARELQAQMSQLLPAGF